MSRRLNRHFSKEDIQMAKRHEKMLIITDYLRNTNQNYHEVPPHTHQNGHHQKNLQTINAGCGKREPSYSASGNANWYNHQGEQYRGSLKNYK